MLIQSQTSYLQTQIFDCASFKKLFDICSGMTRLHTTTQLLIAYPALQLPQGFSDCLTCKISESRSSLGSIWAPDTICSNVLPGNSLTNSRPVAEADVRGIIQKASQELANQTQCQKPFSWELRYFTSYHHKPCKSQLYNRCATIFGNVMVRPVSSLSSHSHISQK